MDLGLAGLHLLGNLARLGVAAVVEPSGVGEQVGDAMERLGLADRDLERRNAGAEGVLEFAQHRLEAGVLAVQLVDEHEAGGAALGGLAPQHDGGVVEAAGGVDHEDHQVGGGNGAHGLPGEVEGARGVEQVDLVALPLEHGQRRRQGVTGGLLLGLVVADGGPVLDATDPWHGPGPVQHRLRQRGLARAGRTHQRDVPDAVRRERLHRGTSLADGGIACNQAPREPPASSVVGA